MGVRADGLFVRLTEASDLEWLRTEYDSLRGRKLERGRFLCVFTEGGRGEPLDFDDAETALISARAGEALYFFVYDGPAAENYTFLYEHSVDGEVVRALAYGSRGWWHDDDEIRWRRVEGRPEPWEAEVLGVDPAVGSTEPRVTVDALHASLVRHFGLAP